MCNADAPFPMTAAEARVLCAYYREAEKRAAAQGEYDSAKEYKERAAAIERHFWPRDEWERAWKA